IAENGYVPCCVSTSGAPDPVPEHDSHGQFIYLVAEYYRHTRDRAFLEEMWPLVRRVVNYIDELRHEGMTEEFRGTPYWGMVPASISHEGYSAKPMHSYWDAFFILGGLRDATFIARELSMNDLIRYNALTLEFTRDLLASIDGTMKQHKIDYIPGSVELGDFDATSTTVALNPVGADDVIPRIWLTRTFDKYWEHALEPRTYTPYEWRIAGTFIRLGQPERARALSNYFFNDQRPQAWRQWAEVVHRNPREPAFIGDMPHTWVGSDFIRSTLDSFVYEKDDALVLAAGVADEWLDRGVTVENISTHFGPVSYTIKREDGVVVLRMKTQPLAQIVVPKGVELR
ncbi:MAG: coagulation factor 5/8 type domain-containing protein, partial [Thermoanaerobaculia bacterium]